MRKKVVYSSINTYETLNELNESTKYVWFVFHGMGYLSRYFLKGFKDLPARENYIIAPQAPSKYYMDPEFKKVGASWLTREETALEIDNILNYLAAVHKAEIIPEHIKIIVLGYSQGVSITARWVARQQIRCDKLVFYAGGMPDELDPADFDYLPPETAVWMIYGDRDHYLNPERRVQEEEKFHKLFKGRGRKHIFEGGHALIPGQINNIIDL